VRDEAHDECNGDCQGRSDDGNRDESAGRQVDQRSMADASADAVVSP
jgi:hypothetical protein